MLTGFAKFLPYITIPWSNNIGNIPANRIAMVDQMFDNNIEKFTNKKVSIGIYFSFRTPLVFGKIGTANIACSSPAIDMWNFLIHRQKQIIIRGISQPRLCVLFEYLNLKENSSNPND